MHLLTNHQTTDYRARYYNPTTGRFLSEDPIGLAGGINEYAYAGDNPLSFIDSFGMDQSAQNMDQSDQNKVQCTALQAEAAQLGALLDQVSDSAGWTAFGSGVLTVLSGVGEVPTAGLDTPVTITSATVTDFFATTSFVTGSIAATLKSYASGNSSALWNFDASQVVNLATAAAASRIPFLKPWAERIGDLAEKAGDLASKAEEGCQ